MGVVPDYRSAVVTEGVEGGEGRAAVAWVLSGGMIVCAAIGAGFHCVAVDAMGGEWLASRLFFLASWGFGGVGAVCGGMAMVASKGRRGKVPLILCSVGVAGSVGLVRVLSVWRPLESF